MAAFTETVERRNPAATATGLAVWGWILRVIVTAGFAVLIVALPATGVLVDKGQRAQALQAKYPTQIATLSKIDPITAQLLANKSDVVAQGHAVAEIAGHGTTFTDVVTIQGLTTDDRQEVAALQAVDANTNNALLIDPTNAAAGRRAVGEVSQQLGIPAAQAMALLMKAQSIPAASLTTLRTKGPYVAAAIAALTDASAKIPAADQTFLTRNAEAVQRAQRNNPGQWQTWWWVCFGGQVLFLPFIFLLVGRWSPRKARADELEHERAAVAELAALQGTYRGQAGVGGAGFGEPVGEPVHGARHAGGATTAHAAGSYDAGSYDAGGYDAGGYDAANYDAGSNDAGGYDAGGYEGGTRDGGIPDAGSYGSAAPHDEPR